MRFDVVLYLLGIACFILAVYTPIQFGTSLIPAAFVIVFILFGIFFISYGYSSRPRQFKIVAPATPPEAKAEEKPQEPPSEPTKPSTDLTRIKGIGPKRIAQLRELQIASVEDLAQQSAEELAQKLIVSSKITARWVEQAQNLLREGS